MMQTLGFLLTLLAHTLWYISQHTNFFLTLQPFCLFGTCDFKLLIQVTFITFILKTACNFVHFLDQDRTMELALTSPPVSEGVFSVSYQTG